MSLHRSISIDGRGTRLPGERAVAERIKGYGLAIDYLDGWPHDVRLNDQSPVLSLEKIHRGGFEKGDQRRFGFVEFHGDGVPPRSGLVRSVGDVFCADRRVAEFIWQACLEKIENDAAQGAAA